VRTAGMPLTCNPGSSYTSFGTARSPLTPGIYGEVATAKTTGTLPRFWGQEARWLALLYGHREGPVSCSKSAFEVELRDLNP